jgi:hypothetical protein
MSTWQLMLTLFVGVPNVSPQHCLSRGWTTAPPATNRRAALLGVGTDGNKPVTGAPGRA